MSARPAISERALSHISPPQERKEANCSQCGGPLKRKPRSYDQHKRYFALMKALLFHWPDSHERVFANETALRKYLQMKAGHYTSKAVDLFGIPEKRALLLAQAALEAAAPYSEAVLHGKHLIIYTPKSISYDTLGHKEFCNLNNDIDDIIRAETGLDPERVLRETEKAA